METTEKETINAQGAEVDKVYETLDGKQAKEKQRRSYSPNYLISQFGTVMKNLIEYEMVDEKDVAEMRKLGKKMKDRFLSIDMF